MVVKVCTLFVLLSALPGCAPKIAGTPPSAERTALFKGTATYSDALTLPMDAVLEIWIAEVSPAALAPIVAETAFLTDGKQVPLSFELWYDPRRIDSNRRYAAHAVIRQDGQVLYRTAAGIPVLTQGNPASVALVLNSPADQPAP
jgi:putative lipoprotein